MSRRAQLLIFFVNVDSQHPQLLSDLELVLAEAGVPLGLALDQIRRFLGLSDFVEDADQLDLVFQGSRVRLLLCRCLSLRVLIFQFNGSSIVLLLILLDLLL